MNEFIINNIALFFILVVLLLIVGIVFVSYMIQKQQALAKKLQPRRDESGLIVPNNASEEYTAALTVLNDQYKELSEYVHGTLTEKAGAGLVKSKMVRYDAFEGLGGELSFIWILLDDRNTGYLLHNIYNREGSSCLYTRVIENGVSTTRLAPEEQKVLNELLKE